MQLHAGDCVTWRQTHHISPVYMCIVYCATLGSFFSKDLPLYLSDFESITCSHLDMQCWHWHQSVHSPSMTFCLLYIWHAPMRKEQSAATMLLLTCWRPTCATSSLKLSNMLHSIYQYKQNPGVNPVIGPFRCTKSEFLWNHRRSYKGVFIPAFRCAAANTAAPQPHMLKNQTWSIWSSGAEFTEMSGTHWFAWHRRWDRC